MRFGLAKSAKHAYRVDFNAEGDVPAFAAVVREFSYFLDQDEEDKHPHLKTWRAIVPEGKTALLGGLKFMEATAKLLGDFALRTEEAVEDVPTYCAPHQDFEAVMTEREELGERAERMAIIMRTGLAKHVIFQPDDLAEQFSDYLKTASGE